ncbi:phosphate/phosphite/phosphonate ABC transporter substrate-binding protein [endosymbiont of Riftia pachyptila]|nr:phosphate/phosphite/phosphonate ABC transporter substrate-binding protein [endosymbiont of Riftia pachyptila]
MTFSASGKPIRAARVIALAALLLCATAPPVLAEAENLRAQTLVIGKVSDSPRKHFTRLKPMVDYVGKKMRDLGITRTRVLMAKNNAQMIRYLQQGKVDWVTETLFSSILFEQQAGAEIILRKWKKGVPGYHTVFITRKESDIHNLEDLKGKRLALEDPGSTTAFYIPAGILQEAGLELELLSNPRQHPAPDKVGYAFAKGEINIATWVHKGLADVGAYNNLDWNTPDHTPPVFKKDLRIFHRSSDLPRGFELVRPGLDTSIKQRLIEVLKNTHRDAAAEAVLNAYQQTAKFDEISAETQAILDHVREHSAVARGNLH